jgi:hypothetical protein
VACFSDGTCISSDAARRLACDCGIVEVTEDETGMPLSVGRKTRTIPGSMKRALLRRDRTCRFPGCTTRVFLEGHHIEHWADGGDTSVSNMVCMCSYHHRFVHEYDYTIETAIDGEHRFLDERGRVVVESPEPARPAHLGWEAIRAQNHHLAIDAETPAYGWNGMPVNYYLAIDGLVRADHLE